MKHLLFLFLLLPIISAAQSVKQDYQIPIDPSVKFYSGDTVFYQVNDVNSSGLVNALFDEQNTTDPATTFESGPTTKAYYPATAVLDLGGYYQLSHEYFYTYYGTDDFCMLYGEPFNWSKDTLKMATGGAGWKDFGRTIKTRYLKIFYANKGYQKVRELTLYGHLIGDSLSRMNPDPHPLPTKTSLTMGQFIGFNQVGPSEVDSVGSAIRHYMQLDWMDTVTTTHNLDSLQFVFSRFGHYDAVTEQPGSAVNYFFPGGTDTKVKLGYNLSSRELYNMAQSGVGYFDATQNVPVYALKNKQGKPIDKVMHPDYDATNPTSYDRLARLMWNYAAYYGNVKHPASYMQTPYPNVSGLGIRSYVEAGNEMNQDWSGRDKHFTPQEFIAYSSAYYDGNEGAMGPRMGVKNADPNMIVVQAGTAGASTDYLKGMQYFSYYTRKDHSAPFDILNFHAYATSGVNGSGKEPHAASPENYFLSGNNPILNYVKAANELFPGKPVWLTEWGYDRDSRSPLSVAPVPGKDSAEVQADWTARFWLMLSFTGVQRSTIFQLIGNVTGRYGGGKFNTTGLTDGNYVGNKYSDVYATNYFAFPAYYFQRTLWLQLYNYKPDSPLSVKDSIYVYKYVNGDSTAYAVWSGTQTNRHVKYSLNTLPGTSVRIVQLADKHFTGITSYKTADAQGNVMLDVSETPQLVFVGSKTEQTTEPEKPSGFVQPNAIITGSTKEPGRTGEITITLPTNSVTLDASKSTGSADTFKWGILGSSPNKHANILGQGTPRATFTNLTTGEYIFFVNVSGPQGWPSSSLMHVTVQNKPVISTVTVTYSDGRTATITSVGSVTVQMKDGTIKKID